MWKNEVHSLLKTLKMETKNLLKTELETPKKEREIRRKDEYVPIVECTTYYDVIKIVGKLKEHFSKQDLMILMRGERKDYRSHHPQIMRRCSSYVDLKWEIENLNPVFIESTSLNALIDQSFDGLYSYDYDSNIVPVLAKELPNVSFLTICWINCSAIGLLLMSLIFNSDDWISVGLGCTSFSVSGTVVALKPWLCGIF